MERIYNYFPENVNIPGNAKISVRNLSSPRTGDPVRISFVSIFPLRELPVFSHMKQLALCMIEIAAY